MCPEPALLVAYLDGTLFHRDARAVDDHLLTCASCTALLADVRRQRDAELQRSRRSHARTIGLAVAAVAIVAIGVWAVMPRSKSTASPHVTAARFAAVRASSPSKATVTLEDGRVFNTENGGVTWSTP
jgi:anti-sigma factor RsiW